MVLTLRGISRFLVSSMLVLAFSASLRVNIFTNAWRLSLLTMHVCTVPKRPKMLRSSASEQLLKILG